LTLHHLNQFFDDDDDDDDDDANATFKLHEEKPPTIPATSV